MKTNNELKKMTIAKIEQYATENKIPFTSGAKKDALVDEVFDGTPLEAPIVNEVKKAVVNNNFKAKKNKKK